MLAIIRKMIKIPKVNKIFRRSSGIVNALDTASSIRFASLAVRYVGAALGAADLPQPGLFQFTIDRQTAAARARADPPVCALEHDCRTAGAFDARLRRLGKGMGMNFELFRQLAGRENLDRELLAPDQT